LKRTAPDVVVGMGGYASLPVVVAARTNRIPTILHEQNAVPGIANVVGIRFARRIALAFAEAREDLPRDAEVRVVGNPIRRRIATLDRASLRDEAVRAFDLDPARQTVFVMGGSLGAARLNAAATGIASRWGMRTDVQLLVSAGRDHGDELRRSMPAGDGLIVRIVDFVERMELAYAAADLAICRAGAATVAELSATGLPSILVPYPYARGNHQEANARALERAGGARVILDAHADAASVADLAAPHLEDPAGLREMWAAAKGFGKPRAAEDLASWTLELVRAGRG
jgi:UDP-N-acetylglucosamine--N-acetylmuramyl-(pentapeptide) pyrophosphoryl-undecaprenol N-acetylglucosamine transferase